LQEFEQPDWTIPTASVGIEVSLLLAPRPDDCAFSGPQVSTFQAGVASAAERLYTLRGYPPVDVLIFLRNEWRHKLDKSEMAKNLAAFVAKNRPPDGTCITLEPDEPHLEDFSAVRILSYPGSWQAGGVAGRMQLSRDELAIRIAAKNKLLSDYRKRLPGFQIWLLFATAFSVLWNVHIPTEVREATYDFDFDKVLISDSECGVIELKRS
jgi:hypothetical protein